MTFPLVALPPQILGAREIEVLPETSYASFENFVHFPRASSNCLPTKFTSTQRKLPRVSLFEAERVRLDGFRLFSLERKFFTDLSLVSLDLAGEERWFNAKLQSGATENIDPVRLLDDNAASVDIVRDGGILVPASDEPANFGSWIYRIIPKILAAETVSDTEAILVYQQPWMSELLRFLEFKKETIPHYPHLTYRLSKTVVPSLPAPEAYFRPEVMQRLATLHERQDASVDFGDKIYVSRRALALSHPTHRAMENETGLVARLAESGFQEFIPENHSFAQQIAVFDRARVIVGAGGANMFGCVFARHARLIVSVESSEIWLHGHGNLLASVGSAWSIVMGRRNSEDVHSNWCIDVETFVEGLRELMTAIG